MLHEMGACWFVLVFLAHSTINVGVPRVITYFMSGGIFKGLSCWRSSDRKFFSRIKNNF